MDVVVAGGNKAEEIQKSALRVISGNSGITLHENSAKMEEVEPNGLTWVITYVNPTTSISFLENLTY